MKLCIKCNEPHDKDGKFCSRTCANSRSWSENDKLKKSTAAKNSVKVTEQNRLNANNKEKIEAYKKTIIIRNDERLKEIMNINFNDLNPKEQRFKIFKEQNCKCNNCKNDKWLDNEIPLELEHKDGNRKNNNRENLELLCPNCHALTLTWRGRNRKDKIEKKKKVTNEDLLVFLLKNNWNIRQALLDAELAPKGSNYPRCYKIKKEYLNLEI